MTKRKKRKLNKKESVTHLF